MFRVFYIFIIYAIIGWFMEVAIVSVKKRKITARGFLIGPWCPIYGFGALFITFLLKKYYEDPIVLFIMSFLLGTILEYITSYIMEKLFHARWWNYSDHRFHINGRVSLTTSLGFGALGLILVYFFNPFFLKEGYSNIKDITEKANEEVKKVLRNKSIFNRRLLNAFPHLKFIIKDKKN